MRQIWIVNQEGRFVRILEGEVEVDRTPRIPRLPFLPKNLSGFFEVEALCSDDIDVPEMLLDEFFGAVSHGDGGPV